MKNFIQKLLGISELLEETKKLSEGNKLLFQEFEKIKEVGTKDRTHSDFISSIEEILKNYNSENKSQLTEIKTFVESLISTKHTEENLMLLDELKLCENLIFKNVQESYLKNLDSSYTIVSKQNRKTGILNALAATISNAIVANNVVQGLYTTTANPETLIRYSSGLYSSMVSQSSKITDHIGYKPVSFSAMGPMLVFQAATIVTAQLHMKEINKKLTTIDEKLTVLLRYHKYERIAKLKFIHSKITELNSRNFYTIEDFVLMDQMKYDLQIIKEESFLVFFNKLNEVIKKHNCDKNEESKSDTLKIGDINTAKKNVVKKLGRHLENSLNHLKNLKENSTKDFINFISEIQEYGLIEYAEFSLISEKLYESLLAIELMGNLKVKDLNQDRLGKIEELKEQLKIYESQEKIATSVKEFYIQFENTFEEFKNEKINNALKKNKDKILQISYEFNNDLDPLRELLGYESEKLTDEILKSFSDEYEILLDATGEEEIVYMRKLGKGIYG